MVQVCLVFVAACLAISCNPAGNQQRISDTLTTDTGYATAVVRSLADERTPVRDRYVFRHSWHWTYYNTWIPEGEFGHKGEVTVYHDDNSGALLLTPEAYGISDEMSVWILALPTGEYITAYHDAEGRKGLLRDTVQLPGPDETFTSQFRPAGNERMFGENRYGWPTLRGYAYRGGYEKTSEQTEVWLADTAVNLSLLAGFNRRNADARLPLHFMEGIPEGRVEVASHTVSGSGHRSGHELTAISDNYYEINLKDYENE